MNKTPPFFLIASSLVEQMNVHRVTTHHIWDLAMAEQVLVTHGGETPGKI